MTKGDNRTVLFREHDPPLLAGSVRAWDRLAETAIWRRTLGALAALGVGGLFWLASVTGADAGAPLRSETGPGSVRGSPLVELAVGDGGPLRSAARAGADVDGRPTGSGRLETTSAIATVVRTGQERWRGSEASAAASAEVRPATEPAPIAAPGSFPERPASTAAPVVLRGQEAGPVEPSTDDPLAPVDAGGDGLVPPDGDDPDLADSGAGDPAAGQAPGPVDPADPGPSDPPAPTGADPADGSGADGDQVPPAGPPAEDPAAPPGPGEPPLPDPPPVPPIDEPPLPDPLPLPPIVEPPPAESPPPVPPIDDDAESGDGGDDDESGEGDDSGGDGDD